MQTIRIGLEFNGTDGSVAEVNPSSVQKVRDSFKEYPRAFYLLWVNGNRSDTPLRNWSELKDALAKAVIEAETPV